MTTTKASSFHGKVCRIFLQSMLLLLMLSPQPLLRAQGTAFTYQGSLAENGIPATGMYDLLFRFWTNATGEGQVAGPLTNFGTFISNGLFMATLDLGPALFDGTPLWIEIAVRTNGVGAFITLSPRQPLTPTPYAVFASNAGSATNVTGPVSAGQLSGLIANTNLPGSLSFSGTVAAATFSGNGAALTDLTASTGTVPDARFPAMLPAVNGARLIGLPTNIVSAIGLSVFNVNSYGAAAGGPPSSNHVAIELAIQAAHELGGIVYFPDQGTYADDGPHVVPITDWPSEPGIQRVALTIRGNKNRWQFTGSTGIFFNGFANWEDMEVQGAGNENGTTGPVGLNQNFSPRYTLATTQLPAETSSVTVASALICTALPIWTLPKIFAPAPTQTLSSNRGAPSLPGAFAIVALCQIRTSRPITLPLSITMPRG